MYITFLLYISMIARFTEFFLKNEKITFILILIITIFGALSYFLLPKQYNPSIVAPAFLVEIPAYGYSAKEWHEYIVKSVENKIRELVGVDTVFGYATDGYVNMMIAFKVGVDQEVAKTRLYDKMYSNYDLKPYGINDVRIRSIDPEDLPQVSYAIVYSGSDLDTKERGQYLQNIAKTLRENIKKVEGTTSIDIIGWYSNDISIELIPERVENFWVDMMSVISKLKESFGKWVVWSLVNDNKSYNVYIDHNTDTLKSIENFVVYSQGNKKVLLQDIAHINIWPVDIKSQYHMTTLSGTEDAVFIGVAKLKWTNAVHIVENIHTAVEKTREILPKNVQIITIQDEGETAKEATNELMLHLFVSIAIVLVILIIFLGVRDAINAAFCIPMVLGIVFIVALILGLDINRITLFALILSLGILVDDSIVMVENNARHLAMMPRTGKNKFEAILDSVREVGMSIILSTITRIISFVAMFAVTGMMGDYMKPIPIFASIALTASIVVAFSINPFLASFLYKPDAVWHHEKKEGWLLRWYGKKLQNFINRDPKTMKTRWYLKMGFWVSLLLIIVTPIMLDVFRARMLPKADKNQVYLWVDAERNTTIGWTSVITKDIENFLMNYSETGTNIQIIPENLRIIEDINTSIGDRFLPDFANLFRWGNNRTGENQINMRINLVPSHDRDMTSEEFVIRLRPLLSKYLREKYNDLTMRLLEDPPGPPTQATFHMKLKWSIWVSDENLVNFSSVIQKTVESIKDEESIVDLTTSHSTSAPWLEIRLNHDRIIESWLSESQVQWTIQSYFWEIPLSIARYEEWQYGSTQITVSVSREAKKDISSIRTLSFINQAWERVYLDDIADIETGFRSYDIYTDERSETIHIYGEMWSNSVVYPIIRLYGLFGTPEFEKTGFRKISASPYNITFLNLNDGKEYILEWWGEWKLTMDTFRGLGLAMIFSLFVIYFIIVTQFGSFIVGGLVMMTFLFSFFGIFPGFSVLYMTSGVYFTATAMIGVIALGGIVVGNALILLDYINQLIAEWKSLEYAVIEGSKKRFVPVMLTSVAAVAGSFIITSDPVWSGLAWSIIWGLSFSAVLTLYFIPIFYYSYLHRYHPNDPSKFQAENNIENEKELYTHL